MSVTKKKLNLTVIEIDFTTEIYTTSDYSDTTSDYEEFTEGYDEFFKDMRRKKEIKMEDIILLEDNTEPVAAPRRFYYDYWIDLLDDITSSTSTSPNTIKIVNDLVDDTKLTTSKSIDVEIMTYEEEKGYVPLSISQALTDVTTLIKDELAGMFNIEQETDVHKDIDNKTVIHVRTFGFNIIGDKDNDTSGDNITNIVQVPAVIVNNFTEFNDELNALKVEIEKNLQAELEAFISKITENDTLDWEEVTEYTSFDNHDGTNEFKRKHDIIESSTEVVKEEFNTPVTSSVTTTENIISTEIVNIKIKPESPLENETKDVPNDNFTEIITTTPKNIETTHISAKLVATDVAPTVFSSFIQGSDEKIIENKTDTSIVASIEDEENIEVVATTITTTDPTSTTSNPTSTHATKVDKEVEMAVSSTTTTTILPVKVVDVTTTVAPIVTTMEPKDTTVTTTKPLDTVTKVNITTDIPQTKSRIDYKLIENIHENEISNDDISYYDIQDDNSTDYPIIDYIELYKDTMNEEIDYKSIKIPVDDTIGTKNDLVNTIVKDGANGRTNNGSYSNDTSAPESIFPWIVTIFIKNDTNDQFDYRCDGVLLSTAVVLTAGRCVLQTDKMNPVGPENVLVFLGKRSLQVLSEDERISKVKKIKLHDQIEVEGGRADNDLAALVLEDPVEYSDVIKPACIMLEGDFDSAVTTAWGDLLTVVPFVEQRDYCEKNLSDNAFCATIGSDVALCPSMGGAYAVKQTDVWCLRGIRSSDLTPQSFCFDKTVVFTDLARYTDWIDNVLNLK
ncbi:uncharacterized protein LOC126377450 [Pectinophora gossypiella]|uniref:uncharacterized protein LOC126377450 n=1 Tax=Pectinophora gossypiella TaxID=13191 RepID=UPI00214E72C6|nr:uncharacterized protein LOC126377450 [Pectinophora gossypiella]